MSMIFKSYEERIENKNGKISKTSKMTTHNGKKGVEILTKNGITKKKKFKVNSKSLPNMRKSIILPTSILVSRPIHTVMNEDNKTKNIKSKKTLKNIVKSKKFKKYSKSKRRQLKRKLSKVRKSKRKISKKTRKVKKKKPFWKKLIGM